MAQPAQPGELSFPGGSGHARGIAARMNPPGDRRCLFGRVDRGPVAVVKHAVVGHVAVGVVRQAGMHVLGDRGFQVQRIGDQRESLGDTEDQRTARTLTDTDVGLATLEFLQ